MARELPAYVPGKPFESGITRATPFVPPIYPYGARNELKGWTKDLRRFMTTAFPGLSLRIEPTTAPTTLLAVVVTESDRDTHEWSYWCAVRDFWGEAMWGKQLAEIVDRERIGLDSQIGLVLRHQLTVILSEAQRYAGAIQRYLEIYYKRLYNPDSPLSTTQWVLEPIDRLMVGQRCLDNPVAEPAPPAESGVVPPSTE